MNVPKKTMSLFKRVREAYKRGLSRQSSMQTHDLSYLLEQADVKKRMALGVKNVHRHASIIAASEAIRLYEAAMQKIKDEQEYGAEDDKSVIELQDKANQMRDFLKRFTEREVDRALSKSAGDHLYDTAEEELKTAKELRNRSRKESLQHAINAARKAGAALNIYRKEGSERKTSTAEELLADANRFLKRFTQEELAAVA